MRIEINPLDTLFFRDGKPFNMGMEYKASGIFPPPPSVIYGAIRTIYYSNHINELKNANDPDNDPTKDLEITGIYFKIEGRYFLPLPFDLVQMKNRRIIEKNKEKAEKNYKLVSLNMIKTPISSITGIKNILKYIDEVENIENGIISLSDFENYLIGNTDGLIAKKMDDYIQSEPKVGIGRNDLKHTSDEEESRIYSINMNRLINLRLVINFKGLEEIPEEGLMKLGGEGKSAHYKRMNDINISINTYKAEIKNKFKLYFATPAFFKNGWYPEWLHQNSNKEYQGEHKGIKLKLLAAAVGKYISIGGFDIKNNWPKTMRKAIPAGSTYYFEIQPGSSGNILDTFHLKSLSEFKTDKEGFGLTYIGDLK